MAVVTKPDASATVPGGGFGLRLRDRYRSARLRLSGRLVLGIVVVAILLYLVLGPLVMLLISTAQQTHNAIPLGPNAVWSGRNYSDVFAQTSTWTLLLRTLEFGAGALFVAFVISITAAWLIERTNLPLRNVIFVLLIAPAGVPALITSISWSLLLNPTNGILNLPLRDHLGFTFNIYSMPGMIVVQGFSLVPLTFLLITASLRGMNGVLEDAASTSGAPMWMTIRRITLPLLAPALIGALIYEFVNVVETVDVPLVLGLPGHVTVLSTKVYVASHPAVGLPDYGISATYGLLLLVLAVAPLFLYNRMIGHSGSFATVGGKGYRPKVVDLGWWRIPALIGVLFYIFCAFILPFLVLVWTSFQPYYAGISRAALGRATLKGWSKVWTPTVIHAVEHTLVVAAASAFAAMLLATFVSWLIVRSRSRLAWLLDFLAFTPHAMPGVVIGLSVLLIYLLLPVHIYGTVWIIVVAMATQFVSLGTRLTTSGIAQISVSLEEAGSASGARVRQIWRRVLMPLLWPALLNGFLMVFLSAIQNLTLPLMLGSSGNTVLSTLIWGRWDYGDVNGTAILSIVMTTITVVAATILRTATAKRN